MDRRLFVAAGLAAAAAPGAVLADPDYRTGDADHYSHDEVVRAGSNFLGVTAEAIGGAIEHVSKDYGDKPTAYIAGTEGSASFVGGVRYGKGLLYMKGIEQPVQIYWQGPSVGFDWGGDAARVFALCYNLRREDEIYRRFPGVDGSAYLVGGLGVNYQRAEDIVLAPIRAGVGLRLGASIGYLDYSRRRHLLPF